MRLGLIARADNGGLGNLTWEFARHLIPDRVLGIDLGERGRGPTHWDRFPGAVVNDGMDSDLDADLVRRFCDGLDVVYSAETLYRSDVAEIARSVGCRTVLHAMPELWRADLALADVVWAPTTWALERLPAGTKVVPVPVARDRLPYRERTSGSVLYHLGAPAMLDRNGTHLLHHALPGVGALGHLIVGGIGCPTATKRVSVEQRPPAVDYWDAHPPEADVLVLPRRYAGLSLPMQECAAMGMAIITLDLEPQRQWVAAEGLVPAQPWRKAQFAGGEFLIHQCAARDLASVIERLLTDPAAVKTSSVTSDHHAEEIGWDYWTARYRELLEDAVA